MRESPVVGSWPRGHKSWYWFTLSLERNYCNPWRPSSIPDYNHRPNSRADARGRRRPVGGAGVPLRNRFALPAGAGPALRFGRFQLRARVRAGGRAGCSGVRTGAEGEIEPAGASRSDPPTGPGSGPDQTPEAGGTATPSEAPAASADASAGAGNDTDTGGIQTLFEQSDEGDIESILEGAAEESAFEFVDERAE